ncbi:condensation domain-containing protein [Sodalis sp. dw_96]|uniref:condensation domain-containing protein n=1 Tax=Sodalis sp. dw_96 TaxID=2719794 RepID=UPI001BD3B885|nr:condensation domain-containing protein [Sodalis sp. dw_96]
MMRLQLGQLYDIKYSIRPMNLFFGEVLVPLERLSPVYAEVAVRHLAAKYEMLRARFTFNGFDSRTTILAADDPCFSQAFECRPSSPLADTRQVELLAYVNETRKIMSAGVPPLFRYCLFTSPNHQHQRLLFIINHLMCDGISSRILWREFSWAYRRAAKGECIPRRASGHYRRLGEELVNRHHLLRGQGCAFLKPPEGERLDIMAGTALAERSVCLMKNRKTETRRFDGESLDRLKCAARSHGLGLSEFFLLLFLRALSAVYGEGSVAITLWFAPQFIGDWQTTVHDLVGSAAFPVPAWFSVRCYKEITDAIVALKQGLYAAMESAADYAAWFYAPVARVQRPSMPAVSFNFVGDRRCSPDILAYRLAPEEVRIGRTDDELAESPLSCEVETYGDMLELILAAYPDGGLGRLPSLLMVNMEKELYSLLADKRLMN